MYCTDFDKPTHHTDFMRIVRCIALEFWKKPQVREIGYVLILVRDWSDWWCVLQMLKLEEGRKLLNILVYRFGNFGRSHECVR